MRITKTSNIWFKKPQNTIPAAQLGVCLMEGPMKVVFIYVELDGKTNAC